MNHLLSLLLTAILCAAASAQTIKSLGFNTTNGQVVANTTNALTFSNDIKFGEGDLTVSGQVISGSGVSFSFEDADFAYGGSIVRASLGFSTNLNTLWTATNATQARQQIAAAASTIQTDVANEAMVLVDDDSATPRLSYESVSGDGWTISDPTGFRSAINMPLSALTNTSNVTMMRALAGSTNTNEPYSGTIAIPDVGTMVFSNGILKSFTP